MSHRLLLFVIILILPLSSHAAQVSVKDVRVWAGPESTRVVLDISDPVKHKVFSLKDPHRLVVDLTSTNMNRKLIKELEYKRSILRGIRAAPRNGKDYRVVLDLAAKVKTKTFLIKPNQTYGHRLVIDLIDLEQEALAKKEPVKQTKPQDDDRFVIVIDPGHGGEDPGAIGFRKTAEKSVVLQVSKRLQRKLKAIPGVEVYLTRTGDYFLPLGKRTRIARQKQADLFVSIHADGFKDRRVDGASVYALSRRGASSEAAKWLAQRENSADLVGGVSLDDKDDLLASVLLDLSQSATLDASLDLARKVLGEIGSVAALHKKKVGQAGFMVLKSPDIPSILVELGYISNLEEERKMKTKHYQERLANAIKKGVMKYYVARGYGSTKVAQARKHQVRRGETLSAIARRYQVSTQTLRRANRLSDDNILTGSVLLIPN